MESVSRQGHWDNVFSTKGEEEVSWFQESPTISLDLIATAGTSPHTSIIDIGGGSSRLVDSLLSTDFEDVTVLDISDAALNAAKARLGAMASLVKWIVADVTQWQPTRLYELWHDRAAFHFLTEPVDRAAYVQRLLWALKPGGQAIIGTFAIDGPQQCSGLPVVRYDAESLGDTLGAGFVLVETRLHDHRTPGGSVQRFQFSRFRRTGP